MPNNTQLTLFYLDPMSLLTQSWERKKEFQTAPNPHIEAIIVTGHQQIYINLFRIEVHTPHFLCE